jgi:biotin transporter BioY
MNLILSKDLTYSEIFKPKDKIYGIVYDFVLVITLSLLVGISAKIKIFLPFTPVPITFQTFSVLFFSVLLGSKKSLYMILTYILEGIIGLPVFSKGGGVEYFLGPTGGYIIGFLVAGYVVGFLAEKGFDKNFFTTLLTMVIGNIIIYFFGIIWLSKFVGGITNAIILGVVPFIIGDSIKIFLSGIFLPLGWKFIKKIKN